MCVFSSIYTPLLQFQVQKWVQMVAMQIQAPCPPALGGNGVLTQHVLWPVSGKLPQQVTWLLVTTLGAEFPQIAMPCYLRGKNQVTRKWIGFVRLSIPGRGETLISRSCLSGAAPMMSHWGQYRDKTSSCSHRHSI